MSVSFLVQSRTVLMVSDELLYIYRSDSRGVRLIEEVPWSADDFEDNVSDIISKDCNSKPILVLNDMVEQYYRKENVPRVSVLDKQNVIARKLNVAFPNYPVRAALPLKESVPKTARSKVGGVYIFAAVPATESFNKTMAAAKRSLAPIVGLCLLPIESSDMIKCLGQKLVSKSEQRAQWTVFIGEHRSGGLRQVVTRNGELALTRMTPMSAGHEDPEAWAAVVDQEFQATMSYLLRFGFDSSDGLNVILISEPSASDAVERIVDVPGDFYSLSPERAAGLLNLNLRGEELDHYADPLHVSWIVRKNSFILPMKSKAVDNLSRPRQIASFVLVFFIFAAAFQCYQFLHYFQKISEAKDDIQSMTQRVAQLDLQYSKELKRKEDLGYDIQLIQGALELHDKFERQRIKFLPLFYNISNALGRDMRLDKVAVQRPKKSVIQGFITQGAAQPLFISDMQLTFPSTTDIEQGNAEVLALQARLQEMIPDHSVKAVKLLADYEYSKEIVVETGGAESDVTAQDFVAEISIEGPRE